MTRHHSRTLVRSTPLRRRAGFTLISVIVAIALLAVGILALSRTTSNVAAAQTNATSRTTALAIARAHMEQIRSRNPWTLTSESPVRVNTDGVADPQGPFTRSVEVVEESANLVRVLVRVQYPRSSEPVTLVTLTYRGAT